MATQTFVLGHVAIRELESRLKTADFRFNSLAYGHFSARGAGVVINAYRSGKVVVQGGEVEDAVARWLSDLGKPAKRASSEHLPTGALIGTDEAGKGDYFGPLVVAGVAVEEGTGRGAARAGCARLQDPVGFEGEPAGCAHPARFSLCARGSGTTGVQPDAPASVQRESHAGGGARRGHCHAAASRALAGTRARGSICHRVAGGECPPEAEGKGHRVPGAQGRGPRCGGCGEHRGPGHVLAVARRTGAHRGRGTAQGGAPTPRFSRWVLASCGATAWRDWPRWPRCTSRPP